MRVKLLRPGAAAPAARRGGDAGHDLAWCPDPARAARSESADPRTGYGTVREPLDLLDDAGRLVVPAGEVVKVTTGVALDVGASTRSESPRRRAVFGLIKERSSLALRGVYSVGGVIDEGYRGEVVVLLRNGGQYDLRIAPGDRVAQLILLEALRPPVEVVDDLEPSDRGAGGFGSTGR